MELDAFRRAARCILLSLLALPVIAAAAEIGALVAREAGTFLYERQDIRSPKVIMLTKGEHLTPLLESPGSEPWYMVKTTQGIVGWIPASNVQSAAQAGAAGSGETKSDLPDARVSVWSARASDGRILEGTWTIDSRISRAAVSGTWAVWDGTSKVAIRGTWSIQKFSTGWSGVWRAAVSGSGAEYSGSWTADFRQSRAPHLSEIFEAAARQAIKGVWNAADLSGIWAIRAVR